MMCKIYLSFHQLTSLNTPPPARLAWSQTRSFRPAGLEENFRDRMSQTHCSTVFKNLAEGNSKRKSWKASWCTAAIATASETRRWSSSNQRCQTSGENSNCIGIQTVQQITCESRKSSLCDLLKTQWSRKCLKICIPWLGTLKFHDSQNHEKLKNSRKLWETSF